MNLQESIRIILKEEGYIPLPIRRRVTSSDLEEAFDYALETMVTSMDNPNSVIFKEKKPSLWVFSKFVIDDMVTLLEQEYFTNDNRIYFSDTEEDDKTYHEKIRQPLLRHYGKIIKEKYNEVMSSNDEEIIQESIKRILKEESLKQTLMDYIMRWGIRDTASMVGVTVKELLEMVGMKGTQEDMIFITKSIMENEAKEEFNYCRYSVVPSFHSITLYVYIPKPLPEDEGVWSRDQLKRDGAKVSISSLLYDLGGGLIRGHRVNVSNTGDC